MSDREEDLPALLGELTGAVEELQSELEPERGPFRPPTPRDFARFTSEVTIPAIILVLETNVRALRLVQRALRMADDRSAAAEGSATRERATAIGRATVTRLDDALSDLQDALEGRPPEDEARQLLDRVQQLNADIDAELSESAVSETKTTNESEADSGAGDDEAAGVDIDVDAELDALKDDVDDDSAHDGTDDSN